MIIKELHIKNFRSYYGENSFEFKDGLTLIIGGNGDGKTTFFDAIDWLFKTSIENKDASNISEMRAAELEVGEGDELLVSLTFEHDGEKSLEKKFRFEKSDKGILYTKDFSFQGYEMTGSERTMISGGVLLERCFDTIVRKYCLFKGESELNVFEDPTALKTLVDKFSDIRKFEEYVEMTQEFEEKSDDAYKRELKMDDKVSKKAKDLDYKLQEVSQRLTYIKTDIKQQEEVAGTYRVKLELLERHQDTSEKYNEIKERLSNLDKKRSDIRSRIDENYNRHLLDDMWILCAFPSIFKEFQKKVSAHSREKRKQHDEYTEKRGIEKGKQAAIRELTALANGASRLPWYLPDDQTMQEMIDEEICKVCGRPAPRDSEAYIFMKEKLEEYLRQEESKKADEEPEEKPLFEFRHIEDLHNISISLGGGTAREISNLDIRIKDHIEFVASRKQELSRIEAQIRDADEEKQRLLIQCEGLSEEVLDKNFKDLKGFFEHKNRAEQRITELKEQEKLLLEEKAAIDKEYAELLPATGMVKVYAKVHTIFDKIMRAFVAAKKANLGKFIYDLAERSNEYLQMLNVDDFHGIIKITETVNDSASIKLYSSNGTYISEPNGALRTTMYMSVLFAISDLTTLKRDIDYPLIFDAPTSSFESFKEDEFYNVIDKIKKQCIIVTKDLLDKDESTGHRKLNEAKINELTCSVYRIEKERNFNPSDLSTIKTTSIRIK